MQFSNCLFFSLGCVPAGPLQIGDMREITQYTRLSEGSRKGERMKDKGPK